ncbi:MAG TPA: hypothetical protein ACHBZ9_13165 [Arsenophonus nasoniae]|uniref:hypothetical protein n=1 Tax=Arsenophonus nasoniae TaxID=638 RepID=UPI003879C9E5
MISEKFYFYLKPNVISQKEIIDYINESDNRSGIIKNSLELAVKLKKIDYRLPNLITSLSNNEINLINLRYIIDFLQNKDSELNQLEIVAWQKRVKNSLNPERKWSEWIAITEKEYFDILKSEVDDIQVRSLSGMINGDNFTAENNLSVSISPKSNKKNEDNKENTENITLTKAKKIF